MRERGPEERNQGPGLTEAFDWRSWKTWAVFLGFGLGLGMASGAISVGSAHLVEHILLVQTEPNLTAVLLAAAAHFLGFVALSKIVRARLNGGEFYGSHEIVKDRLHNEPKHLWRWWRRSWLLLVVLASSGVMILAPVACDRVCVTMVLCLALATAIIGKEFPVRVLWRPGRSG